jgi:hypothetical protein
MVSLDELRMAMTKARKGSLERLRFDLTPIDEQIGGLRKWIGGIGSSKPPTDWTAAAVNSFHLTRKLSNVRDARFVCYGCVDPVLPGRGKLIEDQQAFPVLLEEVDGYRAEPRIFRSCYRGLLHGYFGYEPDGGHAVGRRNWEWLRSYLHDRRGRTLATGWSPEWVETLGDNPAVFSANPGETYGPLLLRDDDTKFKRLLGTLDINDGSWLVRVSVLGQIDAATAGKDDSFRAHLPRMLALLDRHPPIANEGLKRLLARYRECSSPLVHPGLRDYAVAQWGNPWLKLNAAKWSLVEDSARTMVVDWLKLELIRQFFGLLAADGKNNPRRLRFWERYHDSIDDMYFALGNTAYYSVDADFRAIRKKMEGRLLNLQKGGSPNNNAFIMCIGGFVVVEFGITGNACFVFRRDALPFELETYVNGDGTGLKGEPYVDRMLHTDSSFESWEEKFEKTLLKLMSVRPDGSGGLAGPASESVSHVMPEAKNVGHVAAGPQPTSIRLNTSILQNPAARMVDGGRTLADLCRERNLKVEDFRRQNGNQWVRTDDKDLLMNERLRSFGFTYKAGKGWWRT